MRPEPRLILLVDDDSHVRRLCVKILSRHGYRLLEAKNGTDALTIAARPDGVIHLLLTDVHMPGMNGMELAQAITARRPGTPVLFMSGGDPETMREWLGGDSMVLRKPFLSGKLLQRVAELVDRPAIQESARSQPVNLRREQIRQDQSVGEFRAAVSQARQEFLDACQAYTAKLEESNPWGTPASGGAQVLPEDAGKARRAALQQYLSALRALSDFASNRRASIGDQTGGTT